VKSKRAVTNLMALSTLMMLSGLFVLLDTLNWAAVKLYSCEYKKFRYLTYVLTNFRTSVGL